MTEAILHKLSYEEYDALPGLRSGELKWLRKSPAHYLAKKQKPAKETDAMLFGRLFHKAMENPEKFMDLMTVEPEFTGYTKDGRESKQSGEARQKKKDWYASLPKGAIVIRNDWLEDLTGMVRSVQRHSKLGEMVKDGMREASLQVTCPETGEVLKCRPDHIAVKGYILDFKTTIDASEGYFLKEIFAEWGRFYILNSAHYDYCARLAGVGKGDRFVIAAIEKEAPWGIKLYPLDRGHLEVGESHRSPLTKRLAKCRRDNEWPSYEERAVRVEIPNWVQWPTEYDDEER